jgi:hypothetical protein
MTNTNGKLYEHFDGSERLTLVLEALSRGDHGEADRLSGSCPHKSYTMRDAAFGDRLDTAFDLMAIACIDLRCLTGKVQTLEWAIGGMRLLSTHHHITATFAFMEGERLGKRLPQMDFFRRLPDATADDSPEGEEEDDTKPPRFSQYHDGELATRMMAVEDRMQVTTDLSLLSMQRAVDGLVQELVDLWTAFDRFCRDRLGVSAGVLLAAWEFPTGGEVAEVLGGYPDVRPNPAQVDQYCGLYYAAWDRRIGGLP